MRTNFPFPTPFVLAALILVLVLAGCGPKAVPPPVTEVTDNPRVIEHRILPGETLERIADNYYGDPGRSAGIARDNGITPSGEIAEGSVLALRFNPDEWESARQRAAALDSYNRGVDLLAQERLAEAERQFQLALETAGDLLAARYNLALVQLRRGKSEPALEQLVLLTELRPADADFRFARGNALFQLTRFDEAAAQFAMVLERDPKHTRAAFGFARSLDAAGRLEEAKKAWKQYLELDSTSSWADAARRNYRKLQDGSRK